MALYSLDLLPAPDHELERPASSLRIRNGVPQMACPICLDAVDALPSATLFCQHAMKMLELEQRPAPRYEKIRGLNLRPVVFD